MGGGRGGVGGLRRALVLHSAAKEGLILLLTVLGWQPSVCVLGLLSPLDTGRLIAWWERNIGRIG